MDKVQLGDEVEDLVTGNIGITVARTEWLNGCVRFQVQPRGMNDKDGEPFKSWSADQEQLAIKQSGKVPRFNKPEEQRRAGNREDPTARPGITR